MQISPNFDLREYLHPDVWNQFGASSIWFLDPRLYTINQCLRDRHGQVTINDWLWEGSFVDSGFNLYRKIGADYSQHKFGKATDSKFKNISADEVREDILKHQRFWLEMGLTTLESADYAPTWVHLDTRYTGRNEILIVKPN